MAVDAETRAYFDAFRLELRRDLAEAVTSMRRESRGDLAEVRTELSQAIAAGREASRADLAQAIATSREAGRTDLAEAMATLRSEIRTEATETRRHFDVVSEGLRSDIRLVAEGVVTNTESIERLRSDVARELDERFRVVHLAIGELRALIR